MILLGGRHSIRAAAGGGGGGDPYWNNVVLLLDANTGGLTDLSQSAHTITADFSHVTVSTEQAKFGTKSFKFPGSSQARLSFNDTADWDFGTGDFTIECFARRPGTATSILYLGDYSSMNNGLACKIGTNLLRFDYNNTNTNSSATTVSVDTWYHVAWSRVSGVLYFAKEGTIASSVVNTTSFTPSSGRFAWGDDRYDTVFTGYMDQMRITKGVGRYTGSYTVPTAPFPTA